MRLNLLSRFKLNLSLLFNGGVWSGYVRYIDGWIPKISLFVPIIGYLILFNDNIAENLAFTKIGGSTEFGFSSITRLRLIYFGLTFLGLSNFIYLLKKPYTFRFGTSLLEYTRTGLELFTVYEYNSIHSQIRRDGHLTLKGKYYDSEWQGFYRASINEGEGTDQVVHEADWEKTKNKYGDFLRGLLEENFAFGDQANQSWLRLCVFLTSLGYFLLSLPSLDLFIKVCVSMF